MSASPSNVPGKRFHVVMRFALKAGSILEVWVRIKRNDLTESSQLCIMNQPVLPAQLIVELDNKVKRTFSMTNYSAYLQLSFLP